MDSPFTTGTKFFGSSELNRIVKDAEFAPHLDDEAPVRKRSPKPNLFTSLVAGAAAGTVVDVSLYPLDTIKTRLQSQQGFKASGGFRGIYKGIGPVLIGSAPTSAIFFGSYNGMVNYLKSSNKMSDAWIHFLSASVSETVSATVRVPLELLKQRKQTSLLNPKALDLMKQTLSLEGFSGLYRGFSFASTIAREIPFAALQFPLWEYFKKMVSIKRQRPVTTLETAYCGAAAGGISAALTTPMDVIKTRTMLASKEVTVKYGRLITFYMARDVLFEKGFTGFFAGITPRVLWITLGGFIYFGIYESMKDVCEKQNIVPVQRSEIQSVNLDELRIAEIEKLSMARSAPSYVDENEIDVLDFTERYDPDEDEMELEEWSEYQVQTQMNNVQLGLNPPSLYSLHIE